jgi:hypothetical protein
VTLTLILIYSQIYDDFVFTEPVSPSNISLKFDVLKADQLEIRLYQV